MPIETSSPEALSLIESEEDLQAACRRWSQAEALGLDTEFVRTRTFFPRLGLIQVADSYGCYLIDPLSVGDLAPLLGPLTDRRIVKVLHSCGEDLEVFYHLFAAFPKPLFDTQIAATLAGYGYSLGYQRLVASLLNLEVPKEETRSNWLKRPLTPSQKEYGARDVAYLLPLYKALEQDLRHKGRKAWAEEEFERLEHISRFNLDPRRAHLRIKRSSRLSPRRQAVLEALCTWREEEARRRDTPRNYVVSEKVLLELVARQPSHAGELAEIPGLSPRERKRSGDQWLRLIRQAKDLPAHRLPPPPAAPTPPRIRKRLMDEMRDRVHHCAGELQLPPEFLVQRRVLAKLVGNLERGAPEPLPDELAGWRRGLIGEQLLELAKASVGRRPRLS